MTRFARAKGSKSSNSRTFEDSTDWVEMKKDMQGKAPLKNEDSVKEDDTGTPSAKSLHDPQWAEFDDPSGVSKRKSDSFGSSVGKASKRRKSKQPFDDPDCEVNSEATRNNKGAMPQSNAKGFSKQDDSFSMNPKTTKHHAEKSTLRINGVHIDVEKFHGFFVKADDAARLRALQKRMIKEGIPREEMNNVLKLERRKAEKALAKEKKKVCFQCRKPGHILSECPQSNLRIKGNAGDDEVATGLCYKCGSTEHTHFECKVQKTGEYKFAKCFICQEQGHISSQCPDNPKGLYPRGGGCNICGEVTHLKKDCAQLAKTRSEAVVTLNTFTSEGAVEDIEESIVKPKTSNVKTSKKKVVKF